MEIYYWRNGKRKVDFVVKDGLKPKELIQVCWDIEDPDTKKRELTGLLEGMMKLSKYKTNPAKRQFRRL